ncbi:hypothetical protein NQ317_004511 [Molorchus minor]|uniref:C2 domain-containing protein n=1 Tax=Molorchus minor TaxID=1323400 RepID=A0ABQ9JYM0_9CUCU|nr:hypothetical protein NQ317_004511 [Molorchus minor]
MTRDEEKLALDTLRSLSASALYKTTEKNLNSGRLSSCRCRTCELYNANNFYCDLRRKNIDPYVDNLETQPFNEITRDIQDKYKTNNEDILRYVDSLKVSIKYTVPDSLINKTIPSTSKVNSGLGTNHVRLCSRRSNDTINFKQVSIHDVKNFDKLNLEEHNLSFKLSYRTSKQKSATVLGFASKGLSVFLGDRSPIVVGTLKVSLQLGCGRLYFGQEFIDAIKSTKRNSVVLDSDDSATQLNKIGLPYDIPVFTKNVQEPTYQDSERFKKNEMQKQSNRTGGSAYDSVGHTKNGAIRNTVKQSSYFDIRHEDKQILFGLLYISEAQYLSPPISTYITCRPFCQNETCFSKQVSGTSHPVFNFFQLVPLIFEDDLLHLLRENYMVIEFWRKTEAADEVIGLTKIFLHQFYLAYRNPVILKYLSKNQLPIVGTDWWEPIYRVNSEEVLGQVQVLVALGTEQQINTLKTERGFTSNVVKSKFSFPKPAFSTSAEKNIEKQTHVQNSTLQKYQKGSSRSSSSDREKTNYFKKSSN